MISSTFATDVPAPDSGVSLALIYDGASYTNLAGGRRRASAYEGNLNARLTLDLERLFGWSGVSFGGDALWIHGGQAANLVGDAQGVSNIAAPSATQIEEFWLQKNFLGPQISVLAGLYNLNSEFDRAQTAGLFLNSAFGIGTDFAQSGIGGPSNFPNTALALRVAYKPHPNVVWRTAVLDGVPLRRADGRDAAFQAGDGALWVTEIAVLGRPTSGADLAMNEHLSLGRFSTLPAYDNKFAVGVWYYTASYDDLSDTGTDGLPLRRTGSKGAYLLADKLLANEVQDPNKRTSAFLQLGLSDARVYRFGSYLGVGIVKSGIFGAPASDQLGLALAAAGNGSHYLAAQQRQGIATNAAEITVELSYLKHVRSWLTVQPDLQYVIHPNTDPSLRNALVFTLRFEVALGD